MKRRDFITRTIASTAFIGTARSAFSQADATLPAKPGADNELKRPPSLEASLVSSFVRAAHSDLTKVKHLLDKTPKLIHSSWDWGNGDFETALGGAAHMGDREIALHLLGAGARIDAFAAAMLGEIKIVASLVRFSPAVANARGPHTLSLMHHVAHNGKIAMAEIIAPHLARRGHDFNQALLIASQRGHKDFVAWLLKYGVDNVNFKNFARRTALDLALEQKHEDLAGLLRAAGGMSSL